MNSSVSNAWPKVPISSPANENNFAQQSVAAVTRKGPRSSEIHSVLTQAALCAFRVRRSGTRATIGYCV